MMNKKGFTLIELLAVIVILAALAIILTPIITSVIKSADENSARISAQNYADAVQNYISAQITIGKEVTNGTYTIADLT
jgi:type IV pilus assembly protein PilA